MRRELRGALSSLASLFGADECGPTQSRSRRPVTTRQASVRARKKCLLVGRNAPRYGRSDAAQDPRAAGGRRRRPALADVRYESWAQPEIPRLEELRQVAIEERLAATIELGRHSRVVPE